jgi:hypothetical protein
LAGGIVLRGRPISSSACIIVGKVISPDRQSSDR